MLTPTHQASEKPPSWFVIHLPALLYGWFWFGLILSGLLAPDDRIELLDSRLITEGWHLSLMAAVFGVFTLGLYWLRVTGLGQQLSPPTDSSIDSP
jgi:hypothetical protein